MLLKSGDRILTTHVGQLPRTRDAEATFWSSRKTAKNSIQPMLAGEMDKALRHVRQQQLEAGIDAATTASSGDRLSDLVWSQRCRLCRRVERRPAPRVEEFPSWLLSDAALSHPRRATRRPEAQGRTSSTAISNRSPTRPRRPSNACESCTSVFRAFHSAASPASSRPRCQRLFTRRMTTISDAIALR